MTDPTPTPGDARHTPQGGGLAWNAALRDRLIELVAADTSGTITPDEHRELRTLMPRAPFGEVMLAQQIALGAVSAWADHEARESRALPPIDRRLREVLITQAAASISEHAPSPLKPSDTDVQGTHVAPSAIGAVKAFAMTWWWAPWALLVLSVALWTATSWWRSIPPDPATALRRAIAGIDASPYKSSFVLRGADPDYTGATGEIVWIPGEQRGYVRAKGFPAYKSEMATHQLWAIDPARDSLPISCGTLDLPGDDTPVLFECRLSNVSPESFGVSRERPGGVVSPRGPMRMIAVESPR